jgi:hypothetical protein
MYVNVLQKIDHMKSGFGFLWLGTVPYWWKRTRAFGQTDLFQVIRKCKVAVYKRVCLQKWGGGGSSGAEWPD